MVVASSVVVGGWVEVGGGEDGGEVGLGLDGFGEVGGELCGVVLFYLG